MCMAFSEVRLFLFFEAPYLPFRKIFLFTLIDGTLCEGFNFNMCHIVYNIIVLAI